MGAHLKHLAKAGLTARLEDGALLVTPASKVTPDLREYIRRHRAAIRAEAMPRVSSTALTGLEAVIVELVQDATAFYRDDIEDLAAMSHEALRDTLVAYIGRELYVRRMLGTHGTTVPQPTETKT